MWTVLLVLKLINYDLIGEVYMPNKYNLNFEESHIFNQPHTILIRKWVNANSLTFYEATIPELELAEDATEGISAICTTSKSAIEKVYYEKAEWIKEMLNAGIDIPKAKNAKESVIYGETGIYEISHV